VEQSRSRKIRASNESRDDLVHQIGRDITEFQEATGAVDDAASHVFGLNRTDLRCMSLLFNRGPMTAGQLAEATDLSPGAMTTVLDRLERAGLAHRLADPDDRRRVLVDITSDARDHGERLYGPIRDAGVAMLQRYSAEELRLIRDFVRAGIDLQQESAARIRALAPSQDVRTVVRNAARDVKAAAKEAKADVKAAAKGAKAAAKQAARSVTVRSRRT
jgi:DNA-binding MarR family transcriptional regulator